MTPLQTFHYPVDCSNRFTGLALSSKDGEMLGTVGSPLYSYSHEGLRATYYSNAAPWVDYIIQVELLGTTSCWVCQEQGKEPFAISTPT